MKAQELFEKYPKAGKVVVEYFTKIFMDSLNNEDITDEFKEMAKTEVLNSEYIQDFIEGNPRGLFDVFDDNEIYINVTAFPNSLFTYSIVGDIAEVGSTETSNTRKEAEKLAIEAAFEILNDKL
jgi:hypothetical protein